MHRNDRTGYRWWSDVNSYPSLDAQTKFGPTYLYEYNTRETYGSGITWGAIRISFSDFLFLPPEMEANPSLVSVREFPRL